MSARLGRPGFELAREQLVDEGSVGLRSGEAREVRDGVTDEHAHPDEGADQREGSMLGDHGDHGVECHQAAPEPGRDRGDGGGTDRAKLLDLGAEAGGPESEVPEEGAPQARAAYPKSDAVVGEAIQELPARPAEPAVVAIGAGPQALL